jgi:hypothetical protein
MGIFCCWINNLHIRTCLGFEVQEDISDEWSRLGFLNLIMFEICRKCRGFTIVQVAELIRLLRKFPLNTLSFGVTIGCTDEYLIGFVMAENSDVLVNLVVRTRA